MRFRCFGHFPEFVHPKPLLRVVFNGLFDDLGQGFGGFPDVGGCISGRCREDLFGNDDFMRQRRLADDVDENQRCAGLNGELGRAGRQISRASEKVQFYALKIRLVHNERDHLVTAEGFQDGP